MEKMGGKGEGLLMKDHKEQKPIIKHYGPLIASLKLRIQSKNCIIARMPFNCLLMATPLLL